MSLAEHIFRTFALVGVIGLVLVLGWNEPLKYRFMSRAEIYALENPQQQAAPVADKSWMWDKSGRKLEQGPYKDVGSSRGSTRH